MFFCSRFSLNALLACKGALPKRGRNDARDMRVDDGYLKPNREEDREKERRGEVARNSECGEMPELFHGIKKKSLCSSLSTWKTTISFLKLWLLFFPLLPDGNRAQRGPQAGEFVWLTLTRRMTTTRDVTLLSFTLTVMTAEWALVRRSKKKKKAVLQCGSNSRLSFFFF